jgi:hypothetical protein
MSTDLDFNNKTENIIGEIVHVATNSGNTYISSDFLPCKGGIVSQSNYPDLFAKIGIIEESWSTVTSSTAAIIYSVKQNPSNGNYAFVAGAPYVYYSVTSGDTWIQSSDLDGCDGPIYDLGVDSGNFFFMSSKAASKENYSSSSGEVWTAPPVDNGLGSNPYCVTYNSVKGYFAGTSTGGIWKAATFGGIFTNVTSGTTYAIYTLAANNSYVYYGDGQGGLGTSTNGTNWTRTATYLSGTNSIRSIILANNKIIVAGANGYMKVDGSSVTSGTSNTILGLSYSSSTGRYFYCGGGGAFGSSTNAINWVSENINTSNAMYAIVAGSAGTVIVAGANGNIRKKVFPAYNTSTDFQLPDSDKNLYIRVK